MIKLFDDDEQDKPAKQADSSLSSLNISPDPAPPALVAETPETGETLETIETPETFVADEIAELPESLAQPVPPIDTLDAVTDDEPALIEKVQEEPFATRVDEGAPMEPADPPIHTFEAPPVEEEPPVMATGWNWDDEKPKEEPWPSDPQPVEATPAENATAPTEPVVEQKPAYTPESDGEVIRNSGLAWSAGIIFFGSVVFMMFIGWGADLMLGTSPYGLIGGVVLGSLIGFVQFFRISAQIFRK